MTTTLLVRFPWGRYHATPWGLHVNEAQVEIPPSPWRVLRALYSTWRLRHPGLEPERVEALLGRLAEPPIYHVPPHSFGSSRHYYPDSKHRTGVAGATDLTLDTFAVIDPEAPVAIHWSFDLDDALLAPLRSLAASTPYLGRADSLCTIECSTSWSPPDDGRSYIPLDLDDDAPSDGTVELLAPDLPLDIDALVQRPVDVRRQNLRYPSGSRFLSYTRPSSAPAPSPRRRRRQPRPQPNAVRLAVVGEARPPVTDTVAITDRLRRAALSRLGDDLPSGIDKQLVGTDLSGAPMTSDHHHTHYLALGTDGRISDLLVWAPGGWAEEELEAVRGIGFVWTGDRASDAGESRSKLVVRTSATGTIDEVAPELTGPARTWESLTPYTSPRHRKGDLSTFLENDVGRELRSRPELVSASLESATMIDPPAGSSSAVQFVRARPSKRRTPRHGPRGGWGPGAAPDATGFLRLRFSDEVTGPITLGHLSHFGLGLFRPVD